MRFRLALACILCGFGFLAHSIAHYVGQGDLSKTTPSLVQELVGGSGIVWGQILLFLLAFALVHGLAGWLFALVVAPATGKLAGSWGEASKLLALVAVAAGCWLVLESAGRFSSSAIGAALHGFATSGVGYWLRLLLAAGIGAVMACGLGLHARRLCARLRNASAKHAALLGGAILLGVVGYVAQKPSARPFPNDPERPHIILIGIDGWRRDSVPPYGGEPGLMPFTEAFLERSAVIEEAYTPLARSFPAWWTILTGQFPTTHGARFNLVSDEFYRADAALPRVLGELGYHRIFAIDERRFANIREDHGFDHVIGPGLGAADFLIGSIHDAPLTNLLVNTSIGRWLFPFNHANRAADFTYRPESFDRLLARSIAQQPRKPLFLAVHYELPHHPYRWAGSPRTARPHALGPQFAAYLETLRRVDVQIATLFAELEALEVLENAIVVFLSDHGEAFPGEGSLWERAETGKPVRTPPGHGTHVLGLTQHQVPLAFRRLGGEPLAPGLRRGRASLADIVPTLVDWLEAPVEVEVDGHSLMPVLRGDVGTIASRPIPLETGLNPPSLIDGLIEESRLLEEAAAYYRITADGRLELKPPYMSELIAGKQRAIIHGDRIFALTNPEGGRPLVGDMRDKQVREVAAGDPEIGRLRAAFCAAFTRDLRHLSGDICGRGASW